MADGPSSSGFPDGGALSDASTLLDGAEDAELDAFFRSGDEGTYKGGPIDSIAPVSEELFEDDEESEEAFFARIAARDERRDRYRKQVARFIGGLGVAVVVALIVRVTTHSSADESLAAVNVTAAHAATNAVAAQAPAAPPIVEAPVVAEGAQAEAPTPEVAAAAPAEPAPVELPTMELVAEEPKVPAPAAKQAAPALQNVVAPRSTPQPAVVPPTSNAPAHAATLALPQSAPANAKPKAKPKAKPAAAAPARALSLGSLGVGRAPPTAIFPN